VCCSIFSLSSASMFRSLLENTGGINDDNIFFTPFITSSSSVKYRLTQLLQMTQVVQKLKVVENHSKLLEAWKKSEVLHLQM